MCYALPNIKTDFPCDRFSELSEDSDRKQYHSKYCHLHCGLPAPTAGKSAL